MTNEQIVDEIRHGFSVTANMELLYVNNLYLIRKFILPYVGYESEEDLMQEAYFGLWEAVYHYETSENVLFMTYAKFWIKQRVQRYIEESGSVLRIPSHIRQKINRYKKSVQEYQQIYGKIPTNKEIADHMNMTVEGVQRIQIYMTDVQSIEDSVQGNEDLCLADTLQSDVDLENDAIDQIYDEYQKNVLWGIVERCADEKQRHILEQHFIEKKSLAQIARDLGVSFQSVSNQKNNALRKLRIGRAGKELRDKLEIMESRAYRSGLKQFRVHDDTSTVEYIALRRAELEEEYKQRLLTI